MIDLSGYIERVKEVDPLKVYGKVQEVTGIVIKASGLQTSIGESCEILTDEGVTEAEVVGFKNGSVLLMPSADLKGIRPGSRVWATKKRPFIRVSNALRGRVLNEKGKPIDGKGPGNGTPYPLTGRPINPLLKRRITEPLDLGIRVINGLFTCGKGQRIGIMSGAGVGKSVLLGMIARYTEATVNVIALIGERSREVKEFIDKDLGQEGLTRSVVVVATADQPPIAKVRAALTATAIAEYFRDRGENVLLLMDSLTRVAQAQREIGLAVGEPPTVKGYTPSVFTLIPQLLERVGTSEHSGTITGIYTVLVEGDDSVADPIADSAKAVLDGHIVLSRELASEGLYPSVDVMQSISRVMPDIVDPTHRQYALKFVETYSTYKKYEDMITIGAYKAGSNPKVDKAVEMYDRLKRYIKQDINEKRDLADSLQALYLLFDTDR